LQIKSHLKGSLQKSRTEQKRQPPETNVSIGSKRSRRKETKVEAEESRPNDKIRP
jgi:hypothetical protein